MRVEREQYRSLVDGLLEFPPPEFDQMLQYELGMKRYMIAQGPNQKAIVFSVVEYYNYRNTVEELVLAARRYNPTDNNLYEFAQELGIATQVDHVAYDAQQTPEVTPVAAMELQRMVRDINPLLDGKMWVMKLLETENRICRVEKSHVPNKGIGTGFLVGSDTIMTNYHVIESAIDPDTGELKPNSLRLRFDYSVAPDGVSLPPGTVYEVKALLAKSPMSPLDSMPTPPEDPTIDELDYALLLVDGTPGDDPIGGPLADPLAEGVARGCIPMPTGAYTWAPEAPLLIYQHPSGGPLKLAIETNAIEGVNNSHTRVRYLTNTDRGSSGSPCFDMDWNLVALHHAGGARNQGIPFVTILDSLDPLIKQSLCS